MNICRARNIQRNPLYLGNKLSEPCALKGGNFCSIVSDNITPRVYVRIFLFSVHPKTILQQAEGKAVGDAVGVQSREGGKGSADVVSGVDRS